MRQAQGISEKLKDGELATYKCDGESKPINVRAASSHYDDAQRKNIKYIKNDVVNWLNDNGILDSDNYAHLHNLAKNGKILTIDLNIHDSDRVNAIRNWLDSQKIEVRSVYASNILDMEKLYIPDIDVVGGGSLSTPKEVVPKVKTTKDKNGDISIKYVDGISGEDLHNEHPFAGINNKFSRFAGYYGQGGDGEGKIQLLCNSEDSELFKCSDEKRSPLITIKGKHTKNLATDRVNSTCSPRSLAP